MDDIAWKVFGGAIGRELVRDGSQGRVEVGTSQVLCELGTVSKEGDACPGGFFMVLGGV